MQNNTFNLKRFLRTLRLDLLSNKRTMLRYTAGMTFGFSMFYLIFLWVMRKQLIFLSAAGPDVTYRFEPYDMLGGITSFIAMFIMVVAPAYMFMQMKTRQQRAAFLMLPASNLEKWLVRFVTVTVGTACMICVSVLAADLIRFVFALFVTPGDYYFVTWHIVRGCFDSVDAVSVHYNELPMSILATEVFLASWTLLNHSFYALGGSLFRRQPLLLTLASQFVIVLVLLLLGAEVAVGHIDRMLWDSMDVGVDIQTDIESVAVIYAVSAAFLALSALFYWLSYKLFTRMQVINDKWLNL